MGYTCYSHLAGCKFPCGRIIFLSFQPSSTFSIFVLLHDFLFLTRDFFSLSVVIISVIRIIYLYPLLSKWGINKALPALIFSVVECNCIIIAACIPTLRPLYRLIRDHRNIQPTLEEGHHIVNPNMTDNAGYGGTDGTHGHTEEQVENMQDVHDIGGRESRNSSKRVRNKLRKKSSRASDLEVESEKDDEDITQENRHDASIRIGIAE